MPGIVPDLVLSHLGLDEREIRPEGVRMDPECGCGRPDLIALLAWFAWLAWLAWLGMLAWLAWLNWLGYPLGLPAGLGWAI